MPSQHSPSLWAQRETKRLARMSAGFVKDALPPQVTKILDPSSSVAGTLMTPPLADRPPAASDIEVPDAVKKGTVMTKISDRSRKEKRVLFRIDPDEGRILYQSSKDGIVPIEAIKEIRTGPNAQYYREQFKLSPALDSRWITIIYILDGAYKTLHIVADTAEAFELWLGALRKVYAIRLGLMTGLGSVDPQVKETVWERQYWKGADERADQVLEFEEIVRLCRKLNVNLSKEEIKKIFEEIDTLKRGYLDFTQFQQFAKILKRRPDIEGIYTKLASSSSGKFDLAAFVKFMREYQKSTLNDTELAALFSKYTITPSPTPPNPNAPTSTSTPSPSLSLENFTTFLQSADNPPFSEQNRGVWHDMQQPISDYFISTSHNTYLVGHQLIGVSTIEGYIRALLHGCRSVELDIYDGEGSEPMIYHGKTLTSKVALRDICHAIRKYGFAASPYPILLSAEVHCGVEQQDRMVDIMVEVFGDDIVRSGSPVEDRPVLECLPSVEGLRGKILLKAKNLYVVEQLTAVQAARKAESAKATKTSPSPSPSPSPAAPALSRPATLDADTPSPSTSDDEAEALLKEGVNDIKEGLADLKIKWKKLRGTSPNPFSKEKKAPESKKEKEKEKPQKPQKTQMSFRLASLLVYTIGVKCRGVSPSVTYAPEHIFSLSENAANKILRVEGAGGVRDLVRHTHGHLVRVYPKGTRVNSSNYEPHRYWAAGCQLVAINWQTFDLGYMMNQAMFQRNGKCGYVLKPEALRCPEKDLLSKYTQHFLDVTIISAQQLPRYHDSEDDGTSVNPLVEVSLHIPDWSKSPFLPEPAMSSPRAKYSPPADASLTSVSSARTVTFRTPVVRNNGFNPVWREELCLPFDCVGDMRELIFVEFVVRQEGKSGEYGRGAEPLGMYCVPLGCLEQGFRHLPLHDAQLTQHLFSTLFVQISIRDIN